nr:hypothetical protein [Tanacetum cinerariifolium]
MTMLLKTSNVILREKLLSINRLIADFEFLNDNPTPDRVLKSSSSFPIFETSDNSLSYSDNSLPEFETFSDHTEETRSGNTTAHTNNSLPEYDSFCFKIEPDQGRLTSVVMKYIFDNSTNDPLLEKGISIFLKKLLSGDSFPLPENESLNFDHHDDPSFPRPPPELPDVEIFFDFEPNSGEVISAVMNNIDELNEDECFDQGGVKTPFLTLASPLRASGERKLKKRQNQIKIRQKGKRGEAEKSQKQLHWIEEEKLNKTQKEGPEMQIIQALFKKFQVQGLKVQFPESSSGRT